MDKLGVGYEDLRRYNPKLVYTAISGFGQKGPYSSWPAYDNSGQALSGLWSFKRHAGRTYQNRHYNRRSGSYFLWDYRNFSRIYSCAEKTGKGQLVDVAQLDSSLALTENAVSNYTVGNQVQQPLATIILFAGPLRKIQGQRRICVFRRLYRQILEDYL